MSASNTIPYGVKSLVECMSRAVLLAQPDDIPEFLARHVSKMVQDRDDESRDPKKVAFRYEEQWEKMFFQEQFKMIKIPKQSAEKFPSNTSRVSRMSPVKTQRVSSVRVPRRRETVGVTAEKKQRLAPPLLAITQRVRTHRVSPVRTPCQTDTKPSFPSTLSVPRPIKRKAPPPASKQAQGQKSTKGPGSCVYTCRLSDCPFHKKPKKESAAIKKLEPIRTSNVPTVKGQLAEVHVPYRPKGGPIVDPELVPKRTKRGAETGRSTAAGRTLLHGGQGGGFSKGGAGGTDRSLQGAAHTCPQVAHLHTIRYRRVRVQCSEP